MYYKQRIFFQSHTLKSLTNRHGYIAVGGQRGMALIKQLNGDWQATLQTGIGMNNSVHLSQIDEQDVRVTFCNNDHSVSVYSVPSMQKLVTLNVPAAINQGM